MMKFPKIKRATFHKYADTNDVWFEVDSCNLQDERHSRAEWAKVLAAKLRTATNRMVCLGTEKFCYEIALDKNFSCNGSNKCEECIAYTEIENIIKELLLMTEDDEK
jgi:hypothetical protein